MMNPTYLQDIIKKTKRELDEQKEQLKRESEKLKEEEGDTGIDDELAL